MWTTALSTAFAKRVPGDREGLHPPNALVPDSRPQVLGGQQIDRSGDLCEQVAVNLVVIEQIDVVAKEADLHVRAREEDLRVGVKQQQRGPLQVRSLPQVQPVDEGRRRFGQERGVQKARVSSSPAMILSNALLTGLPCRPRRREPA